MSVVSPSAAEDAIELVVVLAIRGLFARNSASYLRLANKTVYVFSPAAAASSG
jgi:hypothetical protein